MIKNMGMIDKSVRIFAAIMIWILFFAGIIHGTLAIVLGIISILLVATSLSGFCPMYLPFGISTIGKKRQG